MAKKSPNRVVWCNKGWQPVYIGFCPSETAWRHEMKAMNVEPRSPYPVSDANMTSFECEGKLTCIITMQSKFDAKWRTEPEAIAAMLAHECTHVWQAILKHMGETDKPGGEIEAYSVQAILLHVMAAYLDTRIRK